MKYLTRSGHGCLDFLNERQIKRLLNHIETMLIDNSKAITEMTPDYESSKQMFEEQKSKYDRLSMDIEDDNTIVAFVKSYQVGKNMPKDFKPMREKSLAESKPKKESKRMDWATQIIKILDKQFITIRDMFDMFPDSINKTGSNYKKFKDACYQMKVRNNKGIVIYRNCIGLAEWTENGIPKPGFMNINFLKSAV